MISVTVEFGNITSASSQNYVKVILFTAAAGVNNYTEDGSASPPTTSVPSLSRIVSKDIGITGIFKVESDGGNIPLSAITWNDVTFSFSIDVEFSGGELITIFYF